MEAKENKDCYTSDNQRQLLSSMFSNKDVKDNFFLTGGTALSVFYLYHRLSDDLDFFTIQYSDLSEIDHWIQRKFENVVKINENEFLLSYLINNVKAEFVIDHLSINDKKQVFISSEQVEMKIDSIRNISSNKLCTLVSRSEVKDFIDFYFLNQNSKQDAIDHIYADSIEKDRIFEDTPTVAFKIEEGFEFVRNSYDILPRLLRNLDKNDFENFYTDLIKRIYNKLA